MEDTVKNLMNLLILSCGTRNLLMRYFKAEGNGIGRVVGTDCSAYAPALYEADTHYIVPPMREANYLDTILDICHRESIDAVLPLQEDELSLIASHRKLFADEGITPIVSAPDGIELCRDKYAFYQHMKKNHFPVMTSCDSFDSFRQMLLSGEMKFPVFLKPSRGCGSIGIHKVAQMDLLEVLCRNEKEPYIIQNFADGEEFGADIYVDLLTRKLITVFIKKKLRMRAGETEKSVSYWDESLYSLIQKTIASLPLSGPIDMDIFKIDGQYYISEINPRFGGGYPHAYHCGIDFPHMIAENISGRANTPQIGNYEEGICMLKYTDLLMTKV